jgi:hypothetical protein
MAVGHPVDEALDDLVVAAASNDIAAVGRLLGPRDVNAVCFNEKELPESLVRHPVGVFVVGRGGWFGFRGADEVPTRVPQCETDKRDLEAVDFDREPGADQADA